MLLYTCYLGAYMSIDKVREYFAQFGMENKILEFETSSETVELASVAVGCEPKRITKTMSFLVDEQPILIAIAGDAKIANAKYKEKFQVKAKMISFDDVEVKEEVVEEEEYINPLEDDSYLLIYEKHHWNRMKEILPHIPRLEKGEYFLQFEMPKERTSGDH